MKNAESKLAGGAWRRFLPSAFCLLHLKMVPEVGIAPASPRLQRGANLPQLLGGMVVPAGNAPASSGYQRGALLLSYGTVSSRGFEPKRRRGRKAKFSFAPGPMRITRMVL